MNKELKAKINAIVRDATKTVPMSKSELRKRIWEVANISHIAGLKYEGDIANF